MAVTDKAPTALPPLKDQQARASDPAGHVWLSASAGTGKTQVLTARVFRLLLRGVDPGAILCLTFTKAGASEMAGRISARLAAWVRMPRTQLIADLAALGEVDGRDIEPLIERARTLFAKVVDAPGGGIRILTIHSFCQSLLAAFPVEAGLAPGFRPIEAREEAVLAREALAEMLVEADRDGRTRPIETIGVLSVRLGEQGAEAFLRECARHGEALAALPLWPDVRDRLRRALGLPDGDVEAAMSAACGDEHFDPDSLRRIAAANRAWGAASGASAADIIEGWLAAETAERVAGLGNLVATVFTAKGEPRKYSAKVLALEPEYETHAVALGTRCSQLLALRPQTAYADLLAAALDVGRDYAAVYARAKARAGAVDFDDLIARALDLLRQPGMGDWVRYKLDLVTEHVLIDEAQDTNPDQWEIVQAIADEFFVGAGTHGDYARTLFTVGDFKQAIFGFQGTHPLFFARAEQHFRALAEGADAFEATRFDRLSLTHSFRSTRPVLEFVDAAIAALPPPGLGDIADRETHASEVDGPGTVSLWPLVEAGGDAADEEGWIEDSVREIARRIARQIKAWLDPANPLMLESKGRSLRPEDVMILVKKRGELASLLVARLYAEGVPVAGVDRLRLNAPLAVQDLLAAIRFVLQPEDSLALAALLVSPLIGWSQDTLMHGAIREGGSLWRHLVRGDDPVAPTLRALMARADFTTPHQFLEEILSGPLDGRRRLVARLGEEARDPIEELLSAALQFEVLGTPSLQRFLDWFDRGDVDVKRDPSAPLDAVRVMTAHGAKGLQAPLVILADAAVDPHLSRAQSLTWRPEGFDQALPIFPPRVEERAAPLAQLMAEAAQRDLEEHWRLFYVAATRAEERLVIAGSLGPRAKGAAPEDSWYAAADRALEALGVARDAERERHFHGLRSAKPVKAGSSKAAVASPAATVPDWLRQPAPAEARPPRPLAPSAMGEDRVADPPPAAAMRAAAERGRLIHALFERLPDVPVAARRGAADRWLAGVGRIVDQAERAQMIETVLAVLERPDYADLFGPNSIAEAPIAATVEGGAVVSGTADRLLVTPDRVVVIDFKTGRSVPRSAADIPPYHLSQMAAYAAALGVIFPGRAVAAALLYTAGPALFTLDSGQLAAHKPGFAPAQQSFDAAP